MILEINPDNPQPRLIRQAVEALKKGAVICYPTDTLYGIGCDIFNKKSILRIHRLKKRPVDKPFSFMCTDLKEASAYGHVSNMGYRIMRKCLPGPYTFILRASKIVPNIMITRQKTVGIRVPDHPVCQELLAGLGNPILNTSAVQDPEEPPALHAFELEERFGRQVDIIIDSGPLPYSSPSTVVSLVGDEVEVLRQGKGDLNCF